MAHKIEIRCPVTEESMLDAMQEVWRQDFKVFGYMRMAGWAALAFAVYVGIKSPTGPLAALPWLAMAGVMIYSNKIQVFKARREIRKFSLLGTETAWSFTQAGTEQVAGGETTREKWEAYHRAVRNPRGFLLYPEKGRVCWLPKSAFASEKDIDMLHKYIAERVKNYKQVTK